MVIIESSSDLRFRGDLVIIESSSNEAVCGEELVYLTCRTAREVKDVTWYWSDQSKEGNNITIRATPNEVVYTCRATSDNGEIGEANIAIVANGEYFIVEVT